MSLPSDTCCLLTRQLCAHNDLFQTTRALQQLVSYGAGCNLVDWISQQRRNAEVQRAFTWGKMSLHKLQRKGRPFEYRGMCAKLVVHAMTSHKPNPAAIESDGKCLDCGPNLLWRFCEGQVTTRVHEPARH